VSLEVPSPVTHPAAAGRPSTAVEAGTFVDALVGGGAGPEDRTRADRGDPLGVGATA